MNAPMLFPGADGPRPGRRLTTISLATLGGISAASAALLFLVVRPFALPLFLAAVFAVIAMPLHERVAALCGGRGWLSALAITGALLVLLLGPAIFGFAAAYRSAAAATGFLERAVREPGGHDELLGRLARLSGSDPRELQARAVETLREGEQILFRRAVQAVGDILSFSIGVCLFLISVFFFLKDGRSIILAWEGLTPLEDEQDRRVRRQFAVVCRSVVSSTILAAIAQTMVFGLGIGLIDLAFGVGLHDWLVLLMLLMFVNAMVPMFGAPVVWVPLTAWLLYRREYPAAVATAALGALLVGSVDNLVRMLVLKGTAGMHPLLALVSVLGGIEWMGVFGVFVGPVIAGVSVTLLRILKPQLDLLRDPPSDALDRGSGSARTT